MHLTVHHDKAWHKQKKVLAKEATVSKMTAVNNAIIKNLFALPAIVALSAGVSAAEWGTDYESAMAQAQEKEKAVLVNFTGSDWCGFCMRLKSEVLDEPSFVEWAGKRFVLLEVDVPNNPQFDRALLEQNQELCAKYGVDGFPTVLVLDAKGRPLGGLFGYNGDVASVRSVLEAGAQAVQLLKIAEGLQGEAKVHALVKAWQLVPADLHDLNKELQAEIKAIDTKDLSGLRSIEDAERRLQACRHAADVAPTDAAALDIVNAALFEAVPHNRRQLLELKYKLMIYLAENHEDVLAAAEVAYEIIDADTRLSEKAKATRKNQLRGVYANPQTTLNRSRTRRRTRPSR